MRLQSPLSAAMWAASWGLLGWWFVQLSVGIFLLAIYKLTDGNGWAVLLFLAAAAAMAIGLVGVRSLSQLLAAKARTRR